MSRPKRWAGAIANANTAMDELQQALDELDELRLEYEEWRDNLPENLAQSPVAEKLDAILDMDFASGFEEIRDVINEADSVELPLGFGRD